jgi:hypothetical protein
MCLDYESYRAAFVIVLKDGKEPFKASFLLLSYDQKKRLFAFFSLNLFRRIIVVHSVLGIAFYDCDNKTIDQQYKIHQEARGTTISVNKRVYGNQALVHFGR